VGPMKDEALPEMKGGYFTPIGYNVPFPMKDVRSLPNLLVITTDQQSATAMSCAGNPYLQTPAMDSLARRGVRFPLTYSSNPICVPSRTSYMTGTMSHANGVTYNRHDHQFDTAAIPSLARFLREAGYDTGHFGKWHVPEPLENRAWSGFDTVGARRDNKVDFDVAAPCTDFITKERGGRPFLAFASFVNPHDICEFARILSEVPSELQNGDIPALPPDEQLPPVPENWEPPRNEPGVIREHYHTVPLAIYPTREWGGPEDIRWRRYLWAYYRMTELVDGHIMKILAALKKSGLEDNTLILFTSDHGDGGGCHHWSQKTLFYDSCSRVPMILQWPGKIREGQVAGDHLVNLGLDLFPTLFEAAGIPQPGHLRGVSLLPAAMGRDHGTPRPFVVSETNLHLAFGKPGPCDGRMLRSRRYKYIRFSQGANPEQFFDMEEDPFEQRSLVDVPERQDVLNEHRRLLDEWMRETGDSFPPYHSP